MKHTSSRIALIASIFLPVISSCFGQFTDAQWLSLGGVPGTDGSVTATAVDGKGNLYVAGVFDTVGDVEANFVAQWNGSQWSILGSGMNNVVDSLAVGPDNTLYAGGSFTMAGGVPANYVARWDGNQWSALGSGITGGYPFGFVRGLAVQGDTVYAGGLFDEADGLPARNIAQWDGHSWSPVGAGLDDTVDTITIWNSNMYCGGAFTYAYNSLSDSFWVGYVAQWDGKQWSALGHGLDYGVNGLAVSGDDLIVAGNFSRAFDTNGVPLTVNYITRWDGKDWSALGSGMNNTINAVAVLDKTVYAGGIFNIAGGVPVNAIAQWNGSAWSALGSGIGATPGGAQAVNALAASGNTLYAGGNYTSAGGVSANNIAQWNGSSWSTMGSDFGPNNSVRAVLISGANLYVGGDLTFAGTAHVNRIARWNGSSWTGVGLGLNGPINALASSGGIIYAGGYFTMATNNDGTVVAANCVAQWNGSNWSALASGLNNQVYALATSGSILYVGGSFTTASNSLGPVNVNYIAQWDGTSWSPLSSGMSGFVPPYGFPSVRALAVSWDGALYAGGSFTAAGGVLVNNIAQWDGFSWYPLGSGTSRSAALYPSGPAPVSALVVSGASLYAAGTFTSVTNANGFGVPANCIAQWNGFTWSALGAGVAADVGDITSVRALAISSDGALYAGGHFIKAGGLPASNIARWNGGSWSRMGSGISGNSFSGAAVSALAVTGSSLFVGGYFTTAGDKICSYAAQAVLATPYIVTHNHNLGFTNGQFGFNISGGNLQSVVIQGSTNLSDWVPVETNVMTGPLFYFSDPSASSYPRRFYRVLLAR